MRSLQDPERKRRQRAGVGPRENLIKVHMQTNIRSYRWLTACGAALVALMAWPSPAAAQLDPLLFLKGNQPNVIVAVDVSNRMQRYTQTDTANPPTTSNYYGTYLYTGSAIT